MKTSVESISVDLLPPTQKNFLIQHTKEYSSKPSHFRVPIYWFEKDNMYWVNNAWSEQGAGLSSFKKNAPSDLYLVGAGTMVRVRYGYCTVYDDRSKTWKMGSQGWANYLEGGDLLQTAIRETHEELTFFTLGSEDERKEILPKGGQPKGAAKTIGIDRIPHSVEIGKIIAGTWNIVSENKTIELITLWDLREIPEPFTVVFDDEWYQGGYFGVPVFVLDHKTHKPLGVFSGQQGFVFFSGVKTDSAYSVI